MNGSTEGLCYRMKVIYANVCILHDMNIKINELVIKWHVATSAIIVNRMQPQLWSTIANGYVYISFVLIITSVCVWVCTCVYACIYM